MSTALILLFWRIWLLVTAVLFIVCVGKVFVSKKKFKAVKALFVADFLPCVLWPFYAITEKGRKVLLSLLSY
jgi:hypothetical protein